MPYSISSTNTIEFGNGSSVNTSLAAQLNASLNALVLPDQHLVEDLISTYPIANLGYDILLSKDGGWILKGDAVQPPESSKIIPITRQDRKWQVNIDHLRCLTEKMDVFPQVMALHRVMGHASPYQMAQAIKSGAWITDVTSDQVIEAMRMKPCPACALGKQNHTPIPRSRTDPNTVAIAQLISGDIVGPVKPATRNGHCYFYLFVDRRTSHLHAFTAPTKDGFITSLRTVYEFYLGKGYTIQTFRSDSENIMVAGAVREFLDCNNVAQHYSQPYEHYQNLVERHVQTVVKLVATNLQDQLLLNATFWDYALFYCVQAWNSTPNTKTDGQPPTRMIDATMPSIEAKRDFVFPFGTPVMVRNHQPAWRFDSKRDLGVFLGPVKGSINGGLVYLPSTGAIVARGDLLEIPITPQEFHRYSNNRKTVLDTDTVDLEESLVIDLPEPKETELTQLGEDPAQPAHNTKPIKGISLSKRQMKKAIQRITTRSMARFQKTTLKAMRASKTDELTVALQGPDGSHWTLALKDEVGSLLQITKTLVPETPDPTSPYDVIYGTVVLKKKMKDLVEVYKYKARLCGCGNQLIGKQDYYNETYSPTVSTLVHSLLLQLAIMDGMHTATIDTVSAYLHQEYPSNLKPLYLKLPKAVADACGLDPQQLYRVKKYLYGLPDSGRAYYMAMATHLTSNGFTRSISDPCLFYQIRDGTRTYLWTHADDMFFASTSDTILPSLIETLSQKFPVKVSTADSHLGINMNTVHHGGLLLTQPKLVQQIIDEYSLDKDGTSNQKHALHNPIPQHQYLSLLGKLLHLTSTRTDIMTDVSYAATKSSQPTEGDYEKLLQIVRYLRNTPNRGLTLFPGKPNEDIYMYAFVDAAYLSHPDGSSHTGYVIGLSSRPEHPRSYFHSKSRKQKLVATSSTHAEMRSLYELTIVLIYITNLLAEIGRPVATPVIIFEDNQPVIDLVSQQIYSGAKRSKHFIMISRFVQEQVEQGLLALTKIPSSKNLSNVLTKIIRGKEFVESFNRIMGIE